jgi:hypothetical protein
MFNPFRNEADAFKVLVWIVAAIAMIVVIVLAIRAIG